MRTPKQIKDLCIVAATQGDGALALEAVRAIADGDFYVNYKSIAPTKPYRSITVKWGNKWCRCGCGSLLEKGDTAMWSSGEAIFVPGHEPSITEAA